MRNIRAVFLTITVVYGLTGCDSNNTVKEAKFSSLEQCLLSIRAATGLPLDPVIDKPDKVSGYLGNTKRNFSCTQKITGTQGIYWNGWYESKR